jgi:hypothetical protein
VSSIEKKIKIIEGKIEDVERRLLSTTSKEKKAVLTNSLEGLRKDKKSLKSTKTKAEEWFIKN